MIETAKSSTKIQVTSERVSQEEPQARDESGEAQDGQLQLKALRLHGHQTVQRRHHAVSEPTQTEQHDLPGQALHHAEPWRKRQEVED